MQTALAYMTGNDSFFLHQVQLQALKKAEEARKAAIAKEEERKARKALVDKKIQEKKQDAKLQEKMDQTARMEQVKFASYACH